MGGSINPLYYGLRYSERESVTHVDFDHLNNIMVGGDWKRKVLSLLPQIVRSSNN